MELTTQQNIVFEQIKAFLNSDASVFILRGYAGTGKTTMVRVIADYIEQSRHLVMVAPTGRANEDRTCSCDYPQSYLYKSTCRA